MTFDCECGKQYVLENSMNRHRRDGKCPIHAGWNAKTERKRKPVLFGPEPKSEPKKKRGRPAFIGPKPKPKTKKRGRPAFICPKPKPRRTGPRPDAKSRQSERQNEKVTCDCGSIVSKCNLTTHKKSKKHVEMMTTGKWEGTKGNQKYPVFFGPKPKPNPIGRPRGKQLTAVVTETEKEGRKKKLQKKRVDCECGTKVLYNSMWSHKQSVKHFSAMAVQAQQCIVINN